jgi:hypothetical protein
MEVLFETWRMLQQNARNNHQQARRGRNSGTQNHQHGEQQGWNSALAHDPDSVKTPSRQALFEAWRVQQQNLRRNEQPRQLLVDPMLRRADSVAFRDDRLFHDQHQRPAPVTEVQGQNNMYVGATGVDETSRAITGAGRKAFSYRIAKQVQERHIRQRIFRKVKFSLAQSTMRES